MKEAPVLLMTYIRSKNTKRILDLIKKYNQKKIFIFNDGLKIKSHKNLHDDTKKVIFDFKKKNSNTQLIVSKKNLTQKNNLPFALSKVFQKHEHVIILEDDCIPNKEFFKFCNILLKKYKNDSRIAQISGNNFLNFKKIKRRNNDSYFFSKFTSSWGWATWKDRWKKIYDKDMKDWPVVESEKWLEDILIDKNSIDFWSKYFSRRFKMLDDDWDRPWTYINFINSRLTIFPSKNLISNIGDDQLALHKNPKKWDSLELERLRFPLKHPKIIVADLKYDRIVSSQGFTIPKLSYRIKNKLLKLLS